jgi:glycine/D-amino acid oxidase-like deaminating enzyme
MAKKNWGNRPWTIEFQAKPREFPSGVEFAVVGGGFTGLAAAAWLKHLAPSSSVALLEATHFGAGASGHTGGMALGESSIGDLPGLGDVLAGYRSILAELQVESELHLPGVYELGRSHPLPNSPIRWKDSGELCVVKEVAGGTIHPGKVVSGLARAAERLGVLLFEYAAVDDCEFQNPIQLHTSLGSLKADRVLFATNAYALELTGWTERAEAYFTLAVMTESLSESARTEIGLGEGKPFYTVDFPYLWGRVLNKQIIFGSGLVHFSDWREMESLDVQRGEAAELFARLEKRVHALHPRLREVNMTNRWGGPIGIAADWKLIFERHPQSKNAIVLGAYSGHGVAQSVYLGAWAAEALLNKRELPNWK